MKEKTHSARMYTYSLSVQEMEYLIAGNILTVKGEGYTYIARVLRLRAGNSLQCIAENGYIATVEIIEKNTNTLSLTCISVYQKERPKHTIILALGASKNLRRSWILEKSVELQIHSLWFWQGEHSQGTLNIKESWRDILKNASTQCKNPYLPTIQYHKNIQALIQETHAIQASTLFFYEDTAQTEQIQLEELDATQKPLVLIIGPEGGFSKAEVEYLHNNTIPARSLGTSTLRYETAGIVAGSLAYMVNDSKGIKKE